jgi:hypothetical protein
LKLATDPDSPSALRFGIADYVKSQRKIPALGALVGGPYNGSTLADGDEMLKDHGTVEERGR